MQHSEILKKYLGKAMIEPGMKTAECVYWAKLYCKERWYPIKAFGGSAWNGWKTGCPFDSKWKRIVKTPTNYPKEGDIIFWSEGRCLNWHVAVANGLSNPMLLRYSDQNWTGKQDPIQNRWWTYKNIVGWFTKL